MEGKNKIKAQDSSSQTINLNLVAINASAAVLATKLLDIASDNEVMATGKTFASRLKRHVMLAIRSNNKNPFANQFTYKSAQNFKLALYNSVKAQYAESLHAPIVYDAAKNVSPKAVKIASAQLFLAGLQVWLEHYNYAENLKKLEDSNLGEDERRKLRRDIAFGQIKLIAGYSNLINRTLSLTKTPLAKAIGKIYPAKDLSPGLFKTTTVNTRVLGGIFGAISIIDGCMSIHTGLTKSGETKVAYLVAGGLQLISGLVVLGQLAGLIAATGILGLTIFAITVLVGVIYENDHLIKWSLSLIYCMRLPTINAILFANE